MVCTGRCQAWSDEDWERAVGAISEATGKGRHTTTATEIYRIDPTTYLADTPGIRALALHGIEPDELDDCFPELRPYRGDCFYPDCTHLHEPGCAVRAALEAGEISARPRGRTVQPKLV